MVYKGTRVEGSVPYTNDAVAALLVISGRISKREEVERRLKEHGNYGDKKIGMQRRGTWLDVTFRNDPVVEDRFKRYFDDLAVFGGSNIALAIARKVPLMNVASLYIL